MKQLLIYMLIISFVLSCNYKNEHSYYHTPSKSQSVLFKEASAMKGLSVFIIGKTTIEDVLKINKEIIKDSRYDKYSSSGDGFYKKNSTYSCPDVELYSISKYYIGDIEIEYLDLYFYKNVLFEINCWTSGALKDAFTKKYGEGVKIESEDVTGSKEDEYLKRIEDIKWENDSIVTTYFNTIEAKGANIISSNNTFKICTKLKVKDEIMKCDESGFKKKENEEAKKRESSLNKF